MISDRLRNILAELPSGVRLVAVSKYHGPEEIMQAYDAGQRIFGESRPQDFHQKAVSLPGDIEWHFIGHLQTNKLKMVLPYASVVESVDSRHLLEEIDKWGSANSRTVDVLLELRIAAEQSKQGLHEEEALDILFDADKFPSVRIRGLMGMATNTDVEDDVRADFARIRAFMDYLRDLFPEYDGFSELSIGMSSDWRIALEFNPTIVRLGSALFQL